VRRGSELTTRTELKIAVISDTHLQTPDERLPGLLEQWAEYADALLHCGDVTGEPVWDLLNSHPTFYSVTGNMDTGRWAAHLPIKRVLEPVPEMPVGMVHGFGLDPSRLHGSLVAQFPAGVRLVCFGHTHRRTWERGPNDVLLLNPGSLYRPKDGRPGYAMLHLGSPEGARVEWVDFP
jgi:hypothetical protein